MSVQVVRQGAETVGAVTGHAEGGVAVVAQQLSDGPCPMVVVNRKPSHSSRLIGLAHEAASVLISQHRVVLLRSQPITSKRPTSAVLGDTCSVGRAPILLQDASAIQAVGLVTSRPLLAARKAGCSFDMNTLRSRCGVGFTAGFASRRGRRAGRLSAGARCVDSFRHGEILAA